MQPLTAAKHRASDPSRRLVKPLDDARRCALARLYARRSAVSDLIGAVERYQREMSRQRAQCDEVTDAERSS
jgi:hypothetical protein